MAIYAAQRSDRNLTLVLINKTTGDLASSVTLTHPAPSGSAPMYSYSSTDLTAIHALMPVAFKRGVATVTVPAMSMNIVVVPE